MSENFQTDASKGRMKMEEYYLLEPIATFAAVGVVAFTLFCLLRLRARIYHPRLRISNAKPPMPPQGLFRWLFWLLALDEKKYLDVVGVDAVAVLLFLRMGLSFFCAVLPFSMATALFNYIPNPPGVPFNSKTYNAFIRATTFENVEARSWVLFIHLVITWAVSILAYAWVLVYYKRIISLRRRRMIQVLETTGFRQVEFRSIMVTNVPSQLRDESALKNYYEGLGFGAVEAVAVYRSCPGLSRSLAKRYKCLNLLERQYFLLHKRCAKSAASRNLSGSRPLPQDTSIFQEKLVDENDNSCIAKISRRITEKIEEMSKSGISYKNYNRDAEKVLSSLRKFIALDIAVRDERKSVLYLGSPSSLAFVTFRDTASAITVLQAKALTLSFACTSRPAPEPRDIYWQSMASYSSPASLRILKSWAILVVHLLLVIFSASIIVAASFLVSAQYLKSNYPSFYGFIFGGRPRLEELFRKFMPTIIASGYTSCLPSVLSLMSMLQGFEAKSWIETSLLSKYFFYQIYNIIIVQTIASSLWSGDEGVLGASLSGIMEALGNLVPANSPQFAKYVALHSFVVFPSELLTADSVEFSVLLNLTRLTTITPRNKNYVLYPANMTSVNYGLAYPSPILIFCIGVICAPLAPFVVPFCILYFLIGLIVRKHVLFYENIPKYETYGRNFGHAVTRVFWGIILMQLTMMGGTILKLRDNSVRHSPGGSSSTDSESSMGAKFLSFWPSPTISVLIVSFPLIIISTLLMIWIRGGYDREMKSVPFGAVRYAEHVADERQRNRRDADEPILTHSRNISDASGERYREYSIYEALTSFLHPYISVATSFIESKKHKNTDNPSAADHLSPSSEIQKTTAECSSLSPTHVEPPSYYVSGILDHPADSFTSLTGCSMYFWCGLNAIAEMNRGTIGNVTVSDSGGTSSSPLIKTREFSTLSERPSVLSLQRDKTLKEASPANIHSFDTATCNKNHGVAIGYPGYSDIFKNVCEYEDLILHCYINPALVGRLPLPWLAGDLMRDPVFTAARTDEAIEQWCNYCEISSIYLNRKSSLIELHQDYQVRNFIKSIYFSEYQPDLPFVRHLRSIVHSIRNWIRAKSR